MKIGGKMILSVVLASLFAGEGIIVYSRRAVHQALLSRIRQSAEEAVRQSLGPLASAVSATDERRLLPVLHDIQRDTGGVYAAALDRDGRVLSHTNVAEVGKVYRDARTAAALASDGESAVEAERMGKPVLDLAVPVFAAPAKGSGDDFLLADAGDAAPGARVGTVRIGLPLDETMALER
ncbi:MAG: hypothetical protein KGJ84_10795, partial [Elusimicrobia bacterium]|nr:hypothetical protein [Elusimicrobiota bacterium]